jgi:hypothetical protein
MIITDMGGVLTLMSGGSGAGIFSGSTIMTWQELRVVKTGASVGNQATWKDVGVGYEGSTSPVVVDAKICGAYKRVSGENRPSAAGMTTEEQISLTWRRRRACSKRITA